MDRNETIIANWKPIHDKGIYAYVIPYALRYFTAMIFIVVGIIKLKQINSIDSIEYLLAGNLFLFAIVLLSRIFDWIKKEKQYNNILKLFEMADRCPACSAKTSPEDKECPYCGLFLGLGKYTTNVLTEEMAKEICTWKYEGEYSVYNFSDWEEVVRRGWSLSIKEERERDFIGIHRNGELVAFGRISHKDGVCILGVGLKPSLCGKGYGKEIMKVLIDESRSRYPDSKIGLEVRVFNQRAIKCYGDIGFEITDRYVKNIEAEEVEYYYMEYEQK